LQHFQVEFGIENFAGGLIRKLSILKVAFSSKRFCSENNEETLAGISHLIQ
jgi:hypothetical protein